MIEASRSVARPGGWDRTVTFLLVGYLCMGRSFAYWGVPPLHLFIGEIVLAFFVFFGPAASVGRWPWIAAKSAALHPFIRAFSISLVFGVLQVAHGILEGNPFLSAIRDLAFNYYPIYFLLGLWTGLHNPNFLQNFLRYAAWVNGVYGMVYILFLSRLSWFYPGVSQQVDPVPIFGQPMFSGALLVGLLCMERNLGRIWLPLLLNAAVLLGMVTRGEWLAFGVGLFLWAWLTKNLGRAAIAAAVVVMLLAAMYITDFTIEAPEGRGGTISAKALAGRILAPIDADLAGDFTSDTQLHEDTVAFRTLWWISIWESVHESRTRTLLGYGYGFPLGDLVPYLAGDFIRTPHNAFFYALGYTGWVGVAIFGLVLAEIARLTVKIYRKTRQPFGIVFWTMMLTYSLFTAFFETPYGAIPFYLIAGCACGPLLTTDRCFASRARATSVGRMPLENPLPRTA